MKVTFFQRNIKTPWLPTLKGLAVKAKSPILLVEDNPLLQSLHQIFLKPIACDVASTGAEALFMASRQRYDLILMDLGLPDISGIEVIQQLRAKSQNKKTAIIILTAQAPNFIPKNLLAQVVQVICKPVDRRTLKNLALHFIK